MSHLLEKIVILPDFQVPLHDERTIRSVIRFIEEWRPGIVGHVGDFTDSTQISRWVRGLRGEFNGGLEGGFERSRLLLELIREAFDGPIHLSRSNHDTRLESAIEQRLPGIAGITIGGQLLSIQNALQLDKFGVTWHDKPFQIAPGVLMMHGDEGGTSQIPGNTALGLATRQRKSVICGHVHRAGLGYSYGLFGLEVGHMMNVADATYLGPARINNWQQAFGILRVYRGNKRKAIVYPELVAIQEDGSFVVEGVRYK